MNTGELIAVVKTQAGVDTTQLSDAVVVGWLNEGLRRLVANSGWLQSILEFGPTVAGQADYPLADNVLRVESLKVDDAPYTAVSTEDIWDLAVGDSRLSGAHGAYAPDYSSSGVPSVTLWPTPDTGGGSVQALCSVAPAALDVANLAGVPPLPEDFHAALTDYAIGLMFLRVEEDAGTAAVFFARFEGPDGKGGEVGRLRRRRVSRVGSGPTQARLSHYGGF